MQHQPETIPEVVTFVLHTRTPQTHTCCTPAPPPPAIVAATGAGALVHLSQPRSPGSLHRGVDPLDPDTLAPNYIERPPAVPPHSSRVTSTETSQAHSQTSQQPRFRLCLQPGEAEPSQMGPLVPTTGAHAFVVEILPLPPLLLLCSPQYTY